MAAHSLSVQKLERALDLNPFISQLETLMSTSIKVPANSVTQNGSVLPGDKPKNVFSVRGIWQTEQERQRGLSEFYNFKTLKKRKWLKNILLEESNSDSDGDQNATEDELRAILKIHRCRRKYQKKYHSDILNSQYTYYGAGLLSEHDRFPEHQQYIQDQYGFDPSILLPVEQPDPSVQQHPASSEIL